MTFVAVTAGETGNRKPEVGEGDQSGSHARTRRDASARGRMVAAWGAVTQRVQARRVAAPPEKWVDPYVDVLTDTPEPVARTDWWSTGPQSPAQQWAAFWAELTGAQGWALRAWVLLVIGPACVVGIAAAGVGWLSQHLGVVAILAAVAFLWWAVTITGGTP